MRSFWSRTSSSSRSSRASRAGTQSRRLSSELLEDRRVLATFVPMGPSPLINGGTENVAPNNAVNGAIHSVVAHPTDANTLYIGSVNGGIWKTNNATNSSPTWTPLTDDLSSLSIGDLEMDPNNSNRLLAGIGRPSSFAGRGGDLTGLLLTEDGGASFTEINSPLFTTPNGDGLEFAAVYINDQVLLAASNGGFTNLRDIEAAFGNRTGGLFRSEDGGATWDSVEVLPPTPEAPDDPVTFNAFDMIADPTDLDRVYLAIQDEGVFRSDDAGATWISATDGDMRQALDTVMLGFDGNGVPILGEAPAGTNNNTEFGIGSDGRVFVGILENAQVEYIAYSDDMGSGWTQMDLPFTPDLENGRIVGLQPRTKPGAQGVIHFSLAVDPNNHDLVYIGGDRQGGDTILPNGNSIGARDGVGRLFRGDVTVERLNDGQGLGFNPTIALPPDTVSLLEFVSPQWEHLTHDQGVIFAPGGGTESRSAPHADSRGFAFDANGDMIEVDDGGIFRRTNPQTNQGDWFSLAGNLEVIEAHNIAYDSVSNVLLAGTQDNGSIEQLSPGSNVWEPVFVPNDGFPFVTPGRFGGDGGDVLIDDTSLPGFSTRYSSAQFMGGFRRQVFDAANNLVSQEVIGGLFINLVDGNIVPLPQDVLFFTTPLTLNNIDPDRILAVTRIGLYESLNQGNDFFIVPGTNPNDLIFEEQNAIVYGGSRFGVSNLQLTYWGLEDEVLIRAESFTNQQITPTEFPGQDVVDLIADDNDWQQLYVADKDEVFFTNNLGDTWGNITGNLTSFDPGELRSIEFVQGFQKSAVIVGANRGVYVTTTDDLGNWQRLGDNLPNAPVYDMEYDETDDVLAIGTLGRGTWIVNGVAAEFTDQAMIAALGSSTV